MVEANLEANQMNQLDGAGIDGVCDMDTYDWYKDIIFYLQYMKAPKRLSDFRKGP